MDWNWYLFSFQGRINRARYWLAMLVCAGWMVFTIWMLVLVLELLSRAGLLADQPKSFHFGVEEVFSLLDPATYRSASRGELVAIAGYLIGLPILLWIYLSTSIKRLHDRDRSGWWMVPFFLLPGLISHFSNRLGDFDTYGLVPLAAGLLYLWGGIEMYFLKGTRWPNRFGPNPLGKQQSRPRGAYASARERGWAQDSEIEFVPHKGSPPPLSHVKRGA
jgi:uncharacterized membrane protein YhaH (DUF805 family)